MSIALWHEIELLKARVDDLERQLEHERATKQPARDEQQKPRGRKAA